MPSTLPALGPRRARPAAALPPNRPGWLRRLLGMRFLVVSIAVHVLLGLFAAIWVVQSYSAGRKLTFKGGPPSPNRSTRAIEHKVQMAKKQSTMSAPANKRIISTGVAKVTLPDMPAMPSAPAASTKMAGASGAAMGGAAGPMGAASTHSGGGLVSMFGLREATGGGLAGSFYDLKQTASRQPTGMNPGKYNGVVIKFLQDGWNVGELNTYYKAPKPLYSAQFMIPDIAANGGPKAFGVENEVQPKLWLALYKGQVVAPESGTFHFVGAGDDILFVRFNGKTVLGACWGNHHDEAIVKPVARYEYDWLSVKQPGGFTKGDSIQVEAGKSYPIEVLIGEQPGGRMHAVVLLEKQGASYPKDAHGNPILPAFRMAESKAPPPGKGETLPPHQEGGAIWKGTSVVKATSGLDAFKKP